MISKQCVEIAGIGKRIIQEDTKLFYLVIIVLRAKFCIVCGCSEEKILEAAHIVDVQYDNDDTTDKDLCLCRNHHKLLLRQLNIDSPYISLYELFRGHIGIVVVKSIDQLLPK